MERGKWGAGQQRSVYLLLNVFACFLGLMVKENSEADGEVSGRLHNLHIHCPQTWY